MPEDDILIDTFVDAGLELRNLGVLPDAMRQLVAALTFPVPQPPSGPTIHEPER
jgi:hypothetical protein